MFGAGIETRLSEWQDDPKTHNGIPSTLYDIPSGPVKVDNDADGPYSEITVPDTFEPGSILVYSTVMEVSLKPELD